MAASLFNAADLSGKLLIIGKADRTAASGVFGSAAAVMGIYSGFNVCCPAGIKGAV